MATLDDAARLAGELPEVEEGERRGVRTWSVGGKTFAWERPFSKADIKRFGAETSPDGARPSTPEALRRRRFVAERGDARECCDVRQGIPARCCRCRHQLWLSDPRARAARRRL